MSELQTLRDEIETYLSRTGMAPTTFGRKAVGDANLVSRVRTEANLTLRTIGRVRQFIRDTIPHDSFTPVAGHLESSHAA